MIRSHKERVFPRLLPRLCGEKKCGFTLIELVVVIVILVLIAGITTHYLVSASRLYAMLITQKQVDGELMDAVSRMRREARLHVNTVAAGSNTWIFSNTVGSINSFILSGTELNLNSNRLAAGVERFTLSYYDGTNGHLAPLPLSVSNCALVGRVALDIKVTNNLADSEMNINFFLQKDLLK